MKAFIAELLRERGLTDKLIYERGGPSPPTMRRVRAGVSVTPHSVTALARVMGLPVDVLAAIVAKTPKGAGK
jgi:hypothetical protein